MIKIIATLEPESNFNLAEEVDLVRLNLGKHPLEKWPKEILGFSRLMYDVGQKLRILVPQQQNPYIGERERLKIALCPQQGELSLNRALDASQLDGAERVVIRDGLLLGEIEDLEEDRVEVEITYRRDTEVPLDKAGINFPGASYPRFYLRDTDREAIRQAQERRVFMLALSNVEQASDIEEALSSLSLPLPIIVPKIETAKGIANLEEIISLKDKLGIEIAIMLAQGDLFNEVGALAFAEFWERILLLCQQEEVSLIVATGLLLSMKFRPFPERAEVLALREIIKKNIEYLMLSDETVPDAWDPQGTIRFLKKFICYYQEERR